MSDDKKNEATLRHYIECSREDIVKYAIWVQMAEKHGLVWQNNEYVKIHGSDIEMHVAHFRKASEFAAKEMVGHFAALGELMTKENWKKPK